jgi:hypothetical protein
MSLSQQFQELAGKIAAERQNRFGRRDRQVQNLALAAAGARQEIFGGAAIELLPPTVDEDDEIPPTPPWPCPPQKARDESIVDLVASENLPQFGVCTVDGKRADSNNVLHFGRVLGVTRAAINIGFSGKVVLEGTLTNPAWNWSPRQKFFLNGTSLSASPPDVGFSQLIAVAETSDTIVVRLGPPILL